MKLGSLKRGRDGALVVISRDLLRKVEVTDIAPTLQAALDDWSTVSVRLKGVYEALNQGDIDSEPLCLKELDAPLPRAYQWVDGSAYLNHSRLMRQARNAELPPSFYSDPLIYQGGSDHFIAGQSDISLPTDRWGVDFEAEIAVITDDIPLGASEQQAADAIRLLVLVNDISLRNLIPAELAKGFGFYQGKPASALSPVCVTPDELGGNWQDSKLSLPLQIYYNEQLFGCPDAGQDMHFSFARLLTHMARTRSVGAGTLVGSGTVSNEQSAPYLPEDGGLGFSCIAEARMVEMIEYGRPSTPFMRFGDRIRIEMNDAEGQSLFGAIDQTLKPSQ